MIQSIQQCPPFILLMPDTLGTNRIADLVELSMSLSAERQPDSHVNAGNQSHPFPHLLLQRHSSRRGRKKTKHSDPQLQLLALHSGNPLLFYRFSSHSFLFLFIFFLSISSPPLLWRVYTDVYSRESTI